ncbi:uncharacterized protein LOC135496530 [Lineus longissimus]|uniref:uncharacterized protein LOC135496530 n=1 Tax=Lineus longissimus TaxID=88925 RepID=UPI002B4E1624
MVQEESFANEMSQLRKRDHETPSIVKKDSQLHKLDPTLDEEGILRVGGRLKQSSIEYGVKHPMILPRASHITTLVIGHHHERVAHQGRGLTMNQIRSSGIWILSCSSAVGSHIYKCVTCRRLRGRPQEQKMSNLPEDRTEASPPFTYCGADCFGPFYVKDNRKEVKRYGVIFTCLALRAVHIEVLDDMSTDAFINGLRCLIAIRGTVRKIRCDQGSNFIGAKHELKLALNELDADMIRAYLLQHSCEFDMNPPAASHMGGIWERMIRSTRSILNGLLDQSKCQLNTSSLRTFLYESMAIINSRPLTVDNLGDPNSPLPLSPNNILTMKSSVIAPPPGEFVKEDIYARKRWRRVQWLSKQFWERWRNEYLLNLQARQKWQGERRNIEVGDVVLLKDQALSRCDWHMAIVEDVSKGNDGLARKTKIRLANTRLDKKGKPLHKATVLERPIHKLVVLVENNKTP